LQRSYDNYFTFSAIDGNFGIATLNSTDIKTNPNKSINPSEFTFKAYVTFIKPIMNGVDGPFLIYQSAIPHLTVEFYCDTALAGIGNMCFLQLEREKNEKLETYFMKVSFQTLGLVIFIIFLIIFIIKLFI